MENNFLLCFFGVTPVSTPLCVSGDLCCLHYNSLRHRLGVVWLCATVFPNQNYASSVRFITCICETWKTIRTSYFAIFTLLMAGTLSVYHWPMQPIKVKLKKKDLPKKNIKNRKKETFGLNIKS